MNYSEYVNQIATLAVVPTDDVNFVAVLPQAIKYAELRMQRDIDFLNTTVSRTSFLPAGTRRFNIADGNPFVVTEQMNLIVPAGTTDPEQGERVPLTPTTKEFIDILYGNSSIRSMPEYYAPLDDEIIIVGPFSDADYTIETVGTVRFESLSPSNPETFISTQLPDVFIMASMIYISGYQRNFGKQADDPTMAVSYESQYQALLKSAIVEELRKKYESSNWSSQGPNNNTIPGRQ